MPKSNESQSELPTLANQAIEYGCTTARPGARNVDKHSYAKELTLLRRALNRRIAETCRLIGETCDEYEEQELSDQLKKQATARDVLSELLSAYFDTFDTDDQTS